MISGANIVYTQAFLRNAQRIDQEVRKLIAQNQVLIDQSSLCAHCGRTV